MNEQRTNSDTSALAPPFQADINVTVFTTGGTIAMGRSDIELGVVPQPGIDLLSSIRLLHVGLNLEQVDLFAKPSASITLNDVQHLADAIRDKNLAGCAGSVVTHGTDTLEETAFALSLLLDTDRPVVITGAMRNPSEPGADGPANLNAAILVAASREACRLGPVVLFGDELHAPHLVRKIHSSRPHAFSSEPFGPIGHIAEGKLDLAMIPMKSPAGMRLVAEIQAVPVIQAGLDLEPETISAFASVNIGALVIAGAGGGHVSSRVMDAISDLARRIPVIITSRVGMGHTLSRSYAYDGSEMDLARRGVINGGRWRPAQARILAQVVLSNGGSVAELADRLAR